MLIFILLHDRVIETEYSKGIDEKEYILFEAQRGNGWCKFL